MNNTQSTDLIFELSRKGRRCHRTPACDVPAIGIPLDPGVAPVTIDLQPMLEVAYDRGRYAELVSYREPADPPLTAEQQAWAEGVLRAKGLLP